MTSYDEFKLLLKKGSFREASLVAKRAAEAGGRDAVFWCNQQAQALLKGNKPKEALRIALQVLENDPENCFAMLAAAEAHFLLGKIGDAQTYYHTASGCTATFEEGKKGIVNCLIKLKRFTDALDEMDGCPRLGSFWFPLKIRALSGLGRIGEAVAECTRWLDGAPNDRTAQRVMFDLDVAYLGEDAALVKYETLAKTASKMSIYRVLKNELLQRCGKGDAVENKKPAELFLLSRKAFTLAKTGRERDAVQLMEVVLRKDPCNEYVNNGYIAAARRIGYMVPAMKFYQELSRLHPEEQGLHHYVRKVSKECRQLEQ